MGTARPAAKTETELACRSCMTGGASHSAGLAASTHTNMATMPTKIFAGLGKYRGRYMYNSMR
jgi:hypothetical protein